MIAPTRNERGNPCSRCVCDECGFEITVPAFHGKSGSDGHGQTLRKLQAQGWTFIKKTLRCPTCEEARHAAHKETTMATELPNEPSRKQKREIMDLLEEVYDTENERYRSGDTDDTVADVLGVMPGWVTRLREEFFGPVGESQEMVDLSKELSAMRIDAAAMMERATEMHNDFTELSKRIANAEAKLGRIRNAVSPRVLEKARA